MPLVFICVIAALGCWIIPNTGGYQASKNKPQIPSFEQTIDYVQMRIEQDKFQSMLKQKSEDLKITLWIIDAKYQYAELEEKMARALAPGDPTWCFGLFIHPIPPRYTIYDPETAKYKDGVLKACQEAGRELYYKKLREKWRSKGPF